MASVMRYFFYACFKGNRCSMLAVSCPLLGAKTPTKENSIDVVSSLGNCFA